MGLCHLLFISYAAKNLPNLIINSAKEEIRLNSILEKKIDFKLFRESVVNNKTRRKEIALYISIKAVWSISRARARFGFKSTQNSEARGTSKAAHVCGCVYICMYVKKRKDVVRKSTCLKEAGCSLLANLVARPACHRTVIHFRIRRVVQPGSVKLLVLFQAVCDGRCAGRRYVGIARVRHLDELARIIECPMESQWRRMALHGAH